MTNRSGKLVLLADDHPVFRSGVRQYFTDRDDFEPPIETGNGDECVDLLLKFQPDWAVIDLAMPGRTGFQILEAMTTSSVATLFVVMSMHADQAYADRAKELGASAFIAKEDAISELDRALLINEGEFYTSKSVGRMAINPLERSLADKLTQLTPAEEKVFQLLSKGLTSREIGEELSISTRTVQTHRRNMTEKLDLHGPNRLLEFAIRNSEQL